MTYFIQIAQKESYSEAARGLSISQPALSMTIKNLEEELGVKLFYTIDRKQRLTDEGRNLYRRALKLIDAFHETIESVQSEEFDGRGSITIGLPPIIGTCFFADLVANFVKDYPHLKVNIVERGAYIIEDMVDEGKVDIAFTITSRLMKNFGVKRITTERNVALVPADHILATRRVISMEALREETFAIFNDNFLLNHQIIDACVSAGFTPKISVLSSQWDFITALVAQGYAVSVLPEPIIRRFPHPGVHSLELDKSVGALRDWDIILIWNKNRYFSKASSAFLKYVTNKFKNNNGMSHA